MNTRILALAAALALSAGAAVAPALAQSGNVPSVAANSVGHWIYDAQGTLVGSVRTLTDGGRTAEIMVGTYRLPGSYITTVPARDLTVADGRTVLQAGTSLTASR